MVAYAFTHAGPIFNPVCQSIANPWHYVNGRYPLIVGEVISLRHGLMSEYIEFTAARRSCLRQDVQVVRDVRLGRETYPH